jgi:abortive infection bacteriophage resistance protein
LIKYLPSSNITKHYCKRNIYDDVLKWKECPLDIMCLTWSFATSFSIFISLPNDARISLLSNFDLSPEHYEGFIVFLKNTLHLRNYISHNNVIYNTEIACQSPSLINLYECVFNKSVSNIRLLHMMELIEHFSHSTTLVSNTRYYLSKLKVQQKFKDKIQLYEDMVNGQKTLQE